MKLTAIVSPEAAGTRLDRFLADTIEELSRTRVKALLDEGAITRDGAVLGAAHKVVAGEEYVCVMPEVKPTTIVAEDIPLDIVFEDEHILVINKPAGLVVHPAPGHSSGTLVNALLAYCKDLPVINGEERPGIVHRLDKDTSGLIVVARSDKAMQGMQRLFKDGLLEKVYSAIVRGLPPGKGTVESEIGRSRRDRKKMASLQSGGRLAITDYLLREALGDYSLLEIRIHTGRTHQIRVHMSDIGHPVVGDRQYGGRRGGVKKGEKEEFDPGRQMLHAWKLSFKHPVTKEELNLVAEYPEDFSSALEVLRSTK